MITLQSTPLKGYFCVFCKTKLLWLECSQFCYLFLFFFLFFFFFVKWTNLVAVYVKGRRFIKINSLMARLPWIHIFSSCLPLWHDYLIVFNYVWVWLAIFFHLAKESHSFSFLGLTSLILTCLPLVYSLKFFLIPK